MAFIVVYDANVLTRTWSAKGRSVGWWGLGGRLVSHEALFNADQETRGHILATHFTPGVSTSLIWSILGLPHIVKTSQAAVNPARKP